jgi:hypothetical protein
MNLKKHIALLLAVALLCVLFTACSANPMKAAAGTYVGQYTKLVGDDEKEEETFTLTLEADGTGKHARDDLELKITWTLEGEAITMKETFLGISIDYTGTLKDGELHLFNGDPEDIWTCEYVYQKQ